MDMQLKKSRPSKNNTKAKLKATAAAMIALNAGVASALPCPSVINSAIASACAFTAGTSVTVSSSGSVFAINMLNYSPTSTPSFITVRGAISGSNTGVKIATSTLTGSISNNGLIHGNSTGVFLTISSAGGISNNGTVTAGNSGINVTNQSTINGDISNNSTGSITASATGIHLGNNSNVTGNISNSGHITTATSGTGIGIHLDANAIVTGNITNSGTITTATSGTAIGISLNTSIITRSIVNSGTINAVTGIKLETTSAVDGGISNSGTINVNGGGNGISVDSSTVGTNGNNKDINNSGAIINANGGAGIVIQTASTIHGKIINDSTGLISGAATGILVMGTSTSVVEGGISNSGTITNGDADRINGIIVDHGIIGTIGNNNGIVNSGTIRTKTTGFARDGINVKNGSTIYGDISNTTTGSIHAATGIEVNASTVNGNVSNAGSISAGSAGLLIRSNAIINGNISNSGAIAVQTTAGIKLYHSTVNGGLSNTGSITAGQAGIIIGNGASISEGISNTNLIQTMGTASGLGISVNSGSNISGGITNSGTINVGSAGNDYGISIIGATIDDLHNDGTINTSGGGAGNNHGIHLATNAIIMGSIFNTGVIHANGATKNYGIYVNSSTISGSIFNSGTIQGNVNGKAIFIDTASSVDSINILNQTARIIGDVEATTTPVNITTGAIFTSEGTFDVRQFNIANGALFYMANPITVNGGTGIVDNSGTLSIATGKQQTITGNYTQQASGVFQIGATNNTNYGQLIAHDVNLSASGAIDVRLQPGSTFHPGDILTNVLQSDTANLTGPSSFTITDNSFLWKFTGSINSVNGVDLTIGIDPAVSTACSGSYCEGAASVIIGQIAAGNPAFSPYAALPTVDAFTIAASKATPELTNENLQAIQLVTRTVLDVLPMPLPQGTSAGDAMLYLPGKVWLKPYGASMTQNQRNTVNGYTASVFGLIGGGDIQIAENWLLGAAVAAGGDHIRGKSVLDGQSIDSSQYQGLIYTSKLFANHTYIAAQGLLGYGSNDSQRIIPLYSSTAKGNFNSWFTNLSAELGWNRTLCDRFIITPAVSASYLYINQSAYTETGSPMDLNVQSNNNSSLVVGADANVAYRAATLNNQQNLSFTGHAGVAYDLLNSQPSTIATFVAGGPSFSTYGIQYNNAVFRGGVGLTIANPTKPFSMNLNYDLQTGNNGYSGLYTATLKYKV